MKLSIKLRCNGYILKPANKQKIADELANLRMPIPNNEYTPKKVFVRCFGNFEIFVDGKILQFGTAKTKELLAYLIDRRGAECKNNEWANVLWDDDKEHFSYYKKCRKDLIDTLKKVDLQDMILKTWGGLAISPDYIECDYYQWLDNAPEGIKAFNGGYMDQYSWAEVTKSKLLK